MGSGAGFQGFHLACRSHLTDSFSSAQNVILLQFFPGTAMPLRHRLISLIALVLLVSLAIGSLLTYWQAIRKIEIEMTSAIASGESTVRDAMITLPEVSDPARQVALLISSFDDERHLRASLVNPAGETNWVSRVRPPTDPAPPWLYRVLAGPEHEKTIALPVKFEAIGAIKLQTDPANEVAEVWEDATLKLMLISGFFAVVLALVYWSLGKALRPLEDLSIALARVGRGDYAAHVSETGPAELAAIYRGFNSMALKLAESEAQNQRLNDQLSTVQEEERADIARDLHDEIGPFLFAVDVDAQTIPQYLERGANAEVGNRAGAIRLSVAHMQGHIRSILSRLRPAMLLDLGLAPAVDQLIAFWATRRPELRIDADIEGQSFGTKLDEAAFRTLQEALSNAVRHGNPSHIKVSAKPSEAGTLLILVSDNGTGLAPQGLKGFGLAGMRERIAALGGAVSIANNTEGGVTVSAEIPIGGKTGAHDRPAALEVLAP
jgi:two-component system, NarL family, sensor histidine kinase UhpB